MANGTITNRYPSSTVSGYLNTNYKIRQSHQILTSTTATEIKNNIDKLNMVNSYLDSAILKLNNAKANCGTDSLSMITSDGNETNTYPKTIDQYISVIEGIKRKVVSLRDTLKAKVDSAVSNDSSAYNRWINSDEYKATQTSRTV